MTQINRRASQTLPRRPAIAAVAASLCLSLLGAAGCQDEELCADWVEEVCDWAVECDQHRTMEDCRRGYQSQCDGATDMDGRPDYRITEDIREEMERCLQELPEMTCDDYREGWVCMELLTF